MSVDSASSTSCKVHWLCTISNNVILGLGTLLGDVIDIVVAIFFKYTWILFCLHWCKH